MVDARDGVPGVYCSVVIARRQKGVGGDGCKESKGEGCGDFIPTILALALPFLTSKVISYLRRWIFGAS